MNSVTLSARAKINLYLEVGEKLPTGFHTVDTVMHRIGLADTVTVSRAPSSSLSMTCSDPRLPCDMSNLVMRAAQAYREAARLPDGVSMHLEKRVPFGAGLGGGSADAASVLLGMQALFDALPQEELHSLAASLGSDVPFCLMDGAALAQGTGTILSPLPPLPSCHCVIVQGKEPVSTPQVYRSLDALNRTPRTLNPLPALLRNGDFPGICRSLYNAFEVLMPSCQPVKEALLSMGALGALMSGSGSAVFGLFTDSSHALAAASSLAGFYCKI